MIIKHGFLKNARGARRFVGFFFLVLIGWAGKFQSQSSQELLAVVVANQARVTLFSRIKNKKTTDGQACIHKLIKRHKTVVH